MNGKAAKRIRQASRCSSHGDRLPITTVKQLKKEYYALPYHRRDMRDLCLSNGMKKGHSERLKQMHRHNEECAKNLETLKPALEQVVGKAPLIWTEYLYSGGTYFKDQYGNKRQGEEIFPKKGE